jgi:hypothetical protein
MLQDKVIRFGIEVAAAPRRGTLTERHSFVVKAWPLLLTISLPISGYVIGVDKVGRKRGVQPVPSLELTPVSFGRNGPM